MYRSYEPVTAYDVYSADLHRAQCVEQAIADEMYSLKHDALERISTVVHPEYEADFIKLLTLGYSEGDQNAENIARKLGLTQSHFTALEEDSKAMRKIVDRELFERMPDYEPEDYAIWV